MSNVLYTIGHGDRRLEDFLRLLTDQGIDTMVDIRSYPHSGRHPHFSVEPLRLTLDEKGIQYHFAGRGLGGLREADDGASVHSALTDPSLRAFAGYMETTQFARAVTQLVNLARLGTTAILCAERDPARCHRRLIADYLELQGITVKHIVDAGPARTHSLSPEARRESARLIYDRSDGPMEGEESPRY